MDIRELSVFIPVGWDIFANYVTSKHKHEFKRHKNSLPVSLPQPILEVKSIFLESDIQKLANIENGRIHY